METQHLAPNSVTNDKLQDDSVTNEKLADGSVTNEKLQDETITRDKLAPGAIQNVDAIVADAIDATNKAILAKDEALEVAHNSTYIDADGWVWEYDPIVKTMVKTDKQIKGKTGDSGVMLEGAVTIVNNLEEGGTDKVLSAEMGKELAQRLNKNEVAIAMGDDGDIFVYLYDYSQVVDAEMDEDGNITLILELEENN